MDHNRQTPHHLMRRCSGMRWRQLCWFAHHQWLSDSAPVFDMPVPDRCYWAGCRNGSAPIALDL